MGDSHATNKQAVREVEVHISPSSTRVRNSMRKLQLFAVPALNGLHMTWGHFQLPEETAKTLT